ncbi:MAG: hypothetical protein RL722_481 [Pseudomonadota bacterium]|jgi:hypothetical protein
MDDKPATAGRGSIMMLPTGPATAQITPKLQSAAQAPEGHAPAAACAPAGRQRLSLALALMLLSACGGGTDPIATNATTDPAGGAPAVDTAALRVEPTYHLAPVLPEAPPDADPYAPSSAARRAPLRLNVPAEFAGLDTRRLALQSLQIRRHSQAVSGATEQAASATDVAPATSPSAGSSTTPAVTPATVSIYEPAQVRAAYGLPELPPVGASLTAEQRAALGAGQTIYIVDAMHDPRAAEELAAFNTKFALPACTTLAIAPTASLPLAAASSSEGCGFARVYSTTAAGMTATAPAYDSNWATEIALDVQWAHAIAPLARIILIEAPNSGVDALTAAVRLANAMGPGVVSMSFGAGEGSYTAYYDSSFSADGMTYLAATGDAGYEVNWPAVSTKVLAVGGTTLSWNGSGNRSETGWSKTGGGLSVYQAVPAYQASGLPGLGSLARRGVPDLAFNADPSSGQYVAVQSPGAATPNWISAGGTSLACPQWAALIAVANAQRQLAGKSVLGAAHDLIYGQIGSQAQTWASAFADITSGRNGSCANCAARSGYDFLTGLGTPNATATLAALVNAAESGSVPVLMDGSGSGWAGIAWTQRLSVSAAHAVAWRLSDAPTGLTVGGSDGVLGWTRPVAGTYHFTVTATDSRNGLAATAGYDLVIAPAPTPPAVAATSLAGEAGKAFSGQIQITRSHPVTVSLAGAPAGLAVDNDGQLSWPNPLAGNRTITVTALDTATGLRGTGKLTLKIDVAQLPPVVGAVSTSGWAGIALGFKVPLTSTNAVKVSLSGAPSGLTVNAKGQGSWAKPVQGHYKITLTAVDSKNKFSASNQIMLEIAATPAPPSISSAEWDTRVGQAWGAATEAAGERTLVYSLAKAPAGMVISQGGALSWPKPVGGAYHFKVSVKDSGTGLSSTAAMTLTVQAPPSLAAASASGKEGVALRLALVAKPVIAGHPLAYRLESAPDGVSVSETGVVSWASPRVGVWKFSAVATDQANEMSKSSAVTLTIAAVPLPPLVTVSSLTGTAGEPFSALVPVTARSGSLNRWVVTQMPLGLAATPVAEGLLLTWASPVAGSYALDLSVTNTAKQTTKAKVSITISAR